MSFTIYTLGPIHNKLRKIINTDLQKFQLKSPKLGNVVNASFDELTKKQLVMQTHQASYVRFALRCAVESRTNAISNIRFQIKNHPKKGGKRCAETSFAQGTGEKFSQDRQLNPKYKFQLPIFNCASPSPQTESTNALSIFFIRKERAYTKLKYSRVPQYDTSSNASAALLAGLLGFIISEKFGFEMVDSGDLYVAGMYVLLVCFTVRLFYKSSMHTVNSTPAYSPL